LCCGRHLGAEAGGIGHSHLPCACQVGAGTLLGPHDTRPENSAVDDCGFAGDCSAQSTGAGTDWNSCLLQVDGGTAVYTVNGHVVNPVLKVMDKNGNPVTSGPIGRQGEQAAV
jgi:hypothetical protein